MTKTGKDNGFSRRRFFKLAAVGGLGTMLLPSGLKETLAQALPAQKPATNINDALNYPRTEWSLPGKFPGKVIKVTHARCVEDGKPLQEPVFQMLEKSMLSLTGASNINDAWRIFVKPGETLGLKLNPIGGKLLSTSHELVRSVIEQLMIAGIPKENIVLWDRREFQLHEAGFTPEAYPGITITGTEKKDADGSFYGTDGRLYSEVMIDKDWYYWADVEGDYDDYTLPYMVNKGKYSYFSKICTQQVDKIINMPILKNAGSSITLCLKNLGYGVITNTGRLHKELWGETSAEVPCFQPVRDKVVLNIADGLIGCFNGGPGANPQFICNYNTLLLGTDPVAVDRIGYDMILAKRIAEGVQQEDVPRSRRFMEYAQELGLGIADREAIILHEIHLT
ncbi:MAG: DUF362 domain-containing protein [Bacteroidales bacterium]|nr:DUF362 domain-containing protein [Bacteroidales bacterium]MDZ4205264.1 DUF362 domain-containing protein [Bacteroidales bacterium]